MLKPLEQFICDTCGRIIDSPKNGYLEWVREQPEFKVKDFNIIHGKWASPLGTPDGCSQHERRSGRSDEHLDAFIGENGIRYLLPWLDVGKEIEETFKYSRAASIREWVELFKRLTLPYYEEARLHFEQAVADGVLDDSENPHCYTSHFYLKKIVERYSTYEDP